jgi:hypothetical protein
MAWSQGQKPMYLDFDWILTEGVMVVLDLACLRLVFSSVFDFVYACFYPSKFDLFF